MRDLAWSYPLAYVGNLVNLTGHALPADLLDAPTFTDRERERLTDQWAAAAPQMKASLDLLVFLAELDDIGKLFKSLLKKAKLLKKFAAMDGTSFIQMSQKALGQYRVDRNLNRMSRPAIAKFYVGKTWNLVGNEWLEYNFALKPTVSDFVGMITGLIQFQRKLWVLLENQGKVLKTHFGFTNTESIGEQLLVSGACPCRNDCGDACKYPVMGPVTGGVGLRRIYTHPKKVKCTGTVMYKYTLPDWFAGMEGSLRGLLANIGFQPGLGTVCELIPFSFVVDWFLPIGKMLERFRTSPVPVYTTILDICFTKRVEESFTLAGKHVCFLEPEKTWCEVHSRNFTRVVGEDCLTMVRGFRLPNWFQLSLGAALGKPGGKRLRI